MIKYFIAISFLILSTAACTEKEGLCECVEATNQVNKLSASFFDGSYSEERKDSLDQAKTLSDSLCAPYIDMRPQDLHKAAQNCPSLKMDPTK
jgi:hypothetical protein